MQTLGQDPGNQHMAARTWCSLTASSSALRYLSASLSGPSPCWRGKGAADGEVGTYLQALVSHPSASLM